MEQWDGITNATLTNETVKVGNGKNAQKINLACCGFDIETTNDRATEGAYMYIWQFGIDGVAYYGRTWDEFFCFLALLRERLSGNIVIGIHNMGFEMSFLLPRLAAADNIERVFAKKAYEPLEVVTKDGFIFRDTKAITNMSLSALAKNYCETQKLVGDLDYEIPRNSSTPLSEQELKYCENDVLILCEFMQYLHKTYTLEGRKIPLTSTGIVRRMVKDGLKGYEYINAKRRVKDLYPDTVDRYNYTMTYLFRGGFCHAQTAICGEVLEGVESDDLTSAYPAEMAHRLYPVTPFERVPPNTALDCITRGLAVIMLVEFTDITAKGAHVLESMHKVISATGAEYENGRLYHADKLKVLITEVDYKIYGLMYKWADMRVIGAKSAVKDFLPKYLLKPMFDVYTQKAQLKKQLANDPNNRELRQIYMSAKAKLNAFYGMTVARLNLTECVFDNGQWIERPNSTYEKEIGKQVLSPYWGIYVTAYTRLTICTAIAAIGDRAYYSDTDSIKHIGGRVYFDKFNAKIEVINRRLCDRNGLDFDIFKSLGKFDNEGTYDKFKTLGAKRYVVQVGDKVECTVAGLPKDTFADYAREYGAQAAFDKFSPDMVFKISGKNAHKYTGEICADICGEIMHELGSCYIYPVSFNMTVDSSFLLAISIRKRVYEYE